jgi:hypothetical protein
MQVAARNGPSEVLMHPGCSFRTRADLDRVRLVRNHLESEGAAPLLFHLVSLKEPREFWPLICREIAERNFFLYCDSLAARASTWVQDELDEVARVAKTRPIRRCGSSLNQNRARRWLDGTPVVQLSLLWKGDDQLWFTLFHELGHRSQHRARARAARERGLRVGLGLAAQGRVRGGGARQGVDCEGWRGT